MFTSVLVECKSFFFFFFDNKRLGWLAVAGGEIELEGCFVVLKFFDYN